MNDPQPEGHMASYIGRRKFLPRFLAARPRGRSRRPHSRACAYGASACRRAWLEPDEGGEKMNPRRTSSIVLMSFLVTLLLPPSQKTGELPAGVKTLRVNGYDMAYMESGNGRPLVMVHGAMSDYRSW